jgi:formamidopyrimidine-DNA glycosylase
LHRALRFATRTAVERGAIPRTSTWLSSIRGLKEARCPRCRADLRRSHINGRTAIWCPRCQPEAS